MGISFNLSLKITDPSDSVSHCKSGLDSKSTLAIDVTLPKSKVSGFDLCFELPEVAP